MHSRSQVDIQSNLFESDYFQRLFAGVLLSSSFARSQIVDQKYVAFLPYLLSTELWARSANVPAALSVLEVSMNVCRALRCLVSHSFCYAISVSLLMVSDIPKTVPRNCDAGTWCSSYAALFKVWRPRLFAWARDEKDLFADLWDLNHSINTVFSLLMLYFLLLRWVFAFEVKPK